MNNLPSKYEVGPKELRRGRLMKLGAIGSPVILGLLPALVFGALFIFAAASPAAGVSILFFGAVFTVVGLLIGLGISGYLAYRHSTWRKLIREQIAADGIRANEIEWFRNELRPAEKRTLKQLRSADVMLADAYRETLASRLTATRIIRSARQERQHAKRRGLSVGKMKGEKAKTIRKELDEDIERISALDAEARAILDEAEMRLRMLEAAAARGGTIADSELALKKLSARSADLPYALEEARIAEEIRKELESEFAREGDGEGEPQGRPERLN